MPPAAQALTYRPLVGILFMCLAHTLFPVMNGLVQVLSRTYPSEQIIWARNTGHLLIVLAVIVPRYGLSVLRTVRPAVQISRSCLLLMSTAMFFFGVKHLPLAQAGSISQMTPFFVTLLAWPIRALGWVLGELPRSVVGYSRVRHVLDATGSMAYGTARLDGDGPAHLAVKDLTYGYDPDVPVLTDVTFEVRPGRTVAIVGPTGSGKSTLTQLLVRLIDPQRGEVRVDGVDLREVERGGVSAVAALVPQQAFLFDDTVRGNITLGLPEITDERVWAALRLAQADGFVSALPQGLDTRVGERGATLSGGQRQRLALARALARSPRLLILDDATSSVDAQVERRILAGLREAGQDATVIVVAYRMATIALADEVIYLEHGRVADRGTHEELLARCAGYRDLVTAYEREEAEREALRAAEEDAGDGVGEMIGEEVVGR